MAKNKVIEQYRIAASRPNVAAESLPFGAYINNDIAELERKYIFNSSWVFVCAAAKRF